jgi:IMP dehydrogenase
MKVIQEGLTFDDVLLIPAHSLIMPNQVILKTQLTKSIQLNIPIVSAAMDSVTESKLAASLASQGGIGILHRHMTSEEQVKQVVTVKKTVIDEASQAIACVDEEGCLRVGAGVGTDQSSQERVRALAHAKVDVIVVDTAHGHSNAVLKMVEWIKNTYPIIQVIGGNIVTARAARALVDHGADCVKVGIGPGAACTTRIVAGVGYPQLSAIQNVAQELEGTDITIIADGGIRFSGDIGKALAAGADSVMLGQLLAGTDEAPGQIMHENGTAYKMYRGMHSPGALADKHSTDDLHFKQAARKLVSEGAEGKVIYHGPLHERLYQLLGGLRACMGYCGCQTIEQLQQQAEFVRITAAGIKESHVHDIIPTSLAQNS